MAKRGERNIKEKHRGYCPRCGNEVDLEHDNHCMKCGYMIRKPKKKGKFPWWVIALLVLIVLYIFWRASTKQPIIPGLG